jgi:hypothetical protein
MPIKSIDAVDSPLGWGECPLESFCLREWPENAKCALQAAYGYQAPYDAGIVIHAAVFA